MAGVRGTVPTSRATLKGVLLTITGALCLSTVPVISKVALSDIPTLHFTALWMALCTVWSVAWLLMRHGHRSWGEIRIRWGAILMTGVFATGWVFFYFAGLQRLDPAVATFIMNSRIVWAIAIGAVFLGERYTALQIVGIVAVATGVVVIFSDVQDPGDILGSVFMLLAAVFFVLSSTVVRMRARFMSVEILLLSRFLLPAIILVPVSIAAGSPLPYLTIRTALLMMGASLIGPFFSFLLIYTALKYLDLGVQNALQSMNIVFTTVLTFLVFHTVPPLHKLVGGGIVLAGVVVIGLVSSRRGRADLGRAGTKGSGGS